MRRSRRLRTADTIIRARQNYIGIIPSYNTKIIIMCIYFVVNEKRCIRVYMYIYIYNTRVVLYYYFIILYAPHTLHASQIGANGRGHHTRKLSGWPARGRSALQSNVFVKSGSAEAAHVKRHRSNTCRVINT